MCVNINIYKYIYSSALYFVHRAPYGGEDSTLYVIDIYIYIFRCISIYLFYSNLYLLGAGIGTVRHRESFRSFTSNDTRLIVQK